MKYNEGLLETRVFVWYNLGEGCAGTEIGPFDLHILSDQHFRGRINKILQHSLHQIIGFCSKCGACRVVLSIGNTNGYSITIGSRCTSPIKAKGTRISWRQRCKITGSADSELRIHIRYPAESLRTQLLEAGDIALLFDIRNIDISFKLRNISIYLSIC